MDLVDTHCHLDMIDDEKIVLLRAKEAGVSKIINVGTSIDASKKSIKIAESTDLVKVYASCGIHAQEGPKDIKKYGSLKGCIDELKRIAASSHSELVFLQSKRIVPLLTESSRSRNEFGMTEEIPGKKVVAIGECGLDFFLDATNKGPETSDQEKKDQINLFEAQVELSKELDLPLIVHCRNGWEETFKIISNFKFQISNKFGNGVFHSWTGNWAAAKKALDLGFYISFSGILTFKNAPLVHEAAKKAPGDRIVVETDAPFLSPVPLRGKTNEPKNVTIVLQFLANLRGESFEKLSEMTTRNAMNLFKL